MADRNSGHAVSPPSTPRPSIHTSEQSTTDVGVNQNGSIIHTETPPANAHTQTQDGSTEILVSNSTANETTVTIDAPDPAAGGGGPRRRVTIHRDNVVRSKKQRKHPKHANGEIGPAAPQKTSYTFLGMLKCWCLELLAILLAAIAVVVIVVLLHYYHDRKVTIWTHNWSINSVFAFLTAIMEAAVAFTIGSCLGQLRWQWFSPPRDGKPHRKMQLKWMDRLTNAKSPPGAVRLVFGNGRTAIRHTAFWGACLIIALLGVGVFTQQVIVIRSANLPVDSENGVSLAAGIPVANYYQYQWQSGASGTRPGDQMPLVRTIAAINAGFLNPSSLQQTNSVLNSIHCPSGNCTFPHYSTLSLCWRCANITDQVLCGNSYLDPSSCPGNGHTRLPDDSVSLDATTGVVNITADDQYPKYSDTTGIGPMVARFVGLGYWNKPAYATECALWWCVATYKSVTENYYATETAVDFFTNSTPGKTQYGQDTDIEFQPKQCYQNGTLKSECHYKVDALSQRALQNYLIYGSTSTNTSGFLKGSVVIPSANNASSWFVKGLAANAIISPCTAQGFGPCNEAFYDEFEWSFYTMAQYMADNIREAAGNYSYGTETRFESSFHVRWGWLAYPVAMVLVALIFLIVTMVKSRYAMPWKSSVTALLLHGLSHEDREQHEEQGKAMDLNDPRVMRDVEDWTVTLQDSGGTRSFKVTSRTQPGSKLHGVEAATEGLGEAAVTVMKAVENM